MRSSTVPARVCQSRWTSQLVDEVFHAFVEHPDYGDNDFITKLKGQLEPASASAKQLAAEMLWALLLLPSNMKARTKRQQVQDIWAMSGQQPTPNVSELSDSVLRGIGSGGPGFNNYRPGELAFVITGQLSEILVKSRRSQIMIAARTVVPLPRRVAPARMSSPACEPT